MIQAFPAPRAVLVFVLGVPLTVAACNSGAEIDTFGGGGSPPAQPLAVDFALRTDLSLGATQTSDAIAVDLDGDGRADLVEANFLDGTIRSALRDALGGYALTEVVPGNGGAVWRLGSGDVDGDGLVDIVAVEVQGAPGSDPAITVFLQDAPGSFGAVVSEPLAGNPIDVDVIPSEFSPLFGGVPNGDLIAVAENGAGDQVSLWRWDGAGLELAGTLNSAALGLGSPLTLAAIDLGHDDLMDLVVGEVDVAGDLPDRVIAYPANGAGGVGAPIPLALSSVPILERVGDVDANGFDDIGVAQLDADTAQVLLFDASGLSEVFNIAFTGGTSSIVFGDLDGQGGLDVAATVLLTQELIVRLAVPPGTASLAFGAPIVLNAGFLPRTVAAVELNDDGLLDLLCPSNVDVSLLFGDGTGNFRAARGYPVGSQPVSVRAADFDGDLDLDLVSVDVFQRQVSFLDNVDGAGHFALVAEIPFEVPASEELPGGLDVGDVDDDGDVDVIIAQHALNEVRVVHNPGTTVAGFNTTTYEIYGLGSMLYGVALGDVNGDAAPDILVSSSGDDTARVLLNDPLTPGQFNQQLPIALPFSPAAVICEDLDGDGDADAAFTGLLSVEVDGVGPGPVLGVLAGDGQGKFALQAALPVDTVGATLASGDFNGDDLNDLVAGQPALAFEQVWVYLSTGGFQFEGTPLSVDGSPGAVSVADVNNDGDLDIVIPTGEGELRVALGDGTGAFPVIEPPGVGTWPVPLGTAFSAFEDVDGDFLPDLVMVSPKAPNVWIGRNVSVELPSM
jgi:hypothetical protein